MVGVDLIYSWLLPQLAATQPAHEHIIQLAGGNEYQVMDNKLTKCLELV